MTKAEKEAAHRFREAMARERLHLRVGDKRRHGTDVYLIGSATELHAIDGVCRCCFGRGS